MTEAWRNALFSSWRLFTLSLYVSSSALSTRFCCCKHSILFCHCSRVIGEGGMEGGCIIGPSVTEDESLSLALSAMFTLRNYRCRNLSLWRSSLDELKSLIFGVVRLYYFYYCMLYYVSCLGMIKARYIAFGIRV